MVPIVGGYEKIAGLSAPIPHRHGQAVAGFRLPGGGSCRFAVVAVGMLRSNLPATSPDPKRSAALDPQAVDHRAPPPGLQTAQRPFPGRWMFLDPNGFDMPSANSEVPGGRGLSGRAKAPGIGQSRDGSATMPGGEWQWRLAAGLPAQSRDGSATRALRPREGTQDPGMPAPGSRLPSGP
jgi:hypothetical protein